MTILIHIPGDGDTAHYADLFIDVTSVTDSTASHDTDLTAGKLVARISDSF